MTPPANSQYIHAKLCENHLIQKLKDKDRCTHRQNGDLI